jgi:PPOX class probable F420-dependent enzyme
VGSNQRSQITMTDAEIATFIEETRTATLATIGPSGHPHLVAMWFGVIDGEIWFETKRKAQKVVNLRRNDRVSVLLEHVETYDSLRGVEIEGRGVVIDDAEQLWKVGVNVWERYTGPYTEEVKPLVEFMLHNRLVVKIQPERIRSWDHTKLGMDPIELGGTTAPFI